ncbi:probable LRR receptor-like serine/threonine-protein kinase At2g16250 [Rutidosis leptorrhynchoides]|uniref:probable LRR receptor-like serine/threonine-protein kinase At2g16250 n=1 Tax=Rutidosis leptorrhynchoides TaxID=125765 RepID=UPI003A99F263
MTICVSLIALLLLSLLLSGTALQQQQQSLQSGSLNSRVERAALFQLRSTLGVRTKQWPIKTDPCLTWTGIVCSENGTVTEINISGFKRTNTGSQTPRFSVDSLANFTQLVSFNASGFLLPGSIPDWLGIQVKTLKFLDLRFCEITGGVPYSIGNLTNLSELYLSGNNLMGSIPSSLGMLSRLMVLDLSINSLTGSIPSSFGNLLNLHYLNLSRNSFSSFVPSQLGSLASLVVIDLSFNAFSGRLPKSLGNLRNLSIMMINDNNFTGELPYALWSLPGLRFFDASYNSFLGSLPNISLNANVTRATFNLSHNMFYGVLTNVVRSFSFVDLSYNYFQGKLPDCTRDVAILDRNCFRSCSNQRKLKECALFYSRKGLLFDNFGLTTLRDRKSKHIMIILVVAVFGSLGFTILLATLVILLIVCSRKKRRTSQTGTGVEPAEGYGEMFAYEKIVAATGGFNESNFIRNGHSGDIFMGVLGLGTCIIVKRFDLQSGKNTYTVESDIFSKISHHRFVPLLGHCLEKEKGEFLIYKYMPNGDLSSSLYKNNGSDDDILKSLDWITRLKIAVGAAEGLSYLHHECSPPIVHRDVQASSILLDNKYEVQLGSLSDACTPEGDRNSKRITRLLRLSQTSDQSVSGIATATCAYDVYCFGKVLLELVTGIIGISASNDSTTKDLLEGILSSISTYDKELVTDIMDPTLVVDEDLLEEVWAMAIIAKSCLHPKPSKRPLMRFVLKALENPLKVVREKTTNSTELRASSSNKCSCGGASWRHSLPRQVGGSQLQDSVDRCLSTIKHSKDVFREPLVVQDEERLNED